MFPACINGHSCPSPQHSRPQYVSCFSPITLRHLVYLLPLFNLLSISPWKNLSSMTQKTPTAVSSSPIWDAAVSVIGIKSCKARSHGHLEMCSRLHPAGLLYSGAHPADLDKLALGEEFGVPWYQQCRCEQVPISPVCPANHMVRNTQIAQETEHTGGVRLSVALATGSTLRVSEGETHHAPEPLLCSSPGAPARDREGYDGSSPRKCQRWRVLGCTLSALPPGGPEPAPRPPCVCGGGGVLTGLRESLMLPLLPVSS